MNPCPPSAPSLLAASAIALFPPLALTVAVASVAAQPVRPLPERRSQVNAPAADPAAAADVIFRAQGVLELGDLVVFQDGSLYDEYIYQGQEGQQITIFLESQDFTPYLILMNRTGDILAQSQDITPRHTDTAIAITLPADGPYSVIVNGLNRYSRGHYTLTVSRRSADADPADAPPPVAPAPAAPPAAPLPPDGTL